MRSSSSSINTILNQSNHSSSSSNSNKSSRKPTSALSKIGKHVPPPISPIIAFKSTTTTTTTSSKVGSSRLAENNTDKTTTTTATATSTATAFKTVNSSSTCAWRIPKVVESPSVNQSSNYPQRKVPELTPVPFKEPEKPKGFLERFEEFPNLLKQQKTPPAVDTVVIETPLPPPQRPPQKLLGGDFNFLEDDDWLDGDNIDYSQNLFEDDDHFLPSYILEDTMKQPFINIDEANVNNNIDTNSSVLCHVKAKSLLAERHHSSKKKDIWKRTDDQDRQQQQTQSQPQSKMKIKILKRNDQSTVAKEDNNEVELTKNFSSSLRLKETVIEEPKQQQPSPPSKIKIVYSSASKTLKKM